MGAFLEQRLAARAGGRVAPSRGACRGKALHLRGGHPGADGYELELLATSALLAKEETESRVRAFLEKRR